MAEQIDNISKFKRELVTDSLNAERKNTNATVIPIINSLLLDVHKLNGKNDNIEMEYQERTLVILFLKYLFKLKSLDAWSIYGPSNTWYLQDFSMLIR